MVRDTFRGFAGHLVRTLFEERTAAHRRLVRNEDRFARYNAQIFTPSGRPYEDLPVVSLGEWRDQLKDNQRGLGLADVQVTSFLR